MEEILTIGKNVDYRKLKIRGGNNNTFVFSDFKTLDVLLEDLRSKNIKIDYAEMKQYEFNAKLTDLSNYTPKVQKSI